MRNKRAIKSLRGGHFNKRICWENSKGMNCYIDLERIAFFYILPKFGFRCESKKLQYIVFGWLFWELTFYRDIYDYQTDTNECKHFI